MAERIFRSCYEFLGAFALGFADFQLLRNSPMRSLSLKDVPFLEFRIYCRHTGDYYSASNIRDSRSDDRGSRSFIFQYFGDRLLSKLTILDKLYIFW